MNEFNEECVKVWEAYQSANEAYREALGKREETYERMIEENPDTSNFIVSMMVDSELNMMKIIEAREEALAKAVGKVYDLLMYIHSKDIDPSDKFIRDLIWVMKILWSTHDDVIKDRERYMRYNPVDEARLVGVLESYVEDINCCNG